MSLPAIAPMEGEHLTQREYIAQCIARAEEETREHQRRVTERRREYEREMRAIRLAGQLCALHIQADMYRELAETLRK